MGWFLTSSTEKRKTAKPIIISWNAFIQFVWMHKRNKWEETSRLTFPHGDSQDGSPGLEVFHRAKSFCERFSLRRSAEILKSPARQGSMRSRAIIYKHRNTSYRVTLNVRSCLQKSVPSPSCRAFWSPTASGTSLAYECPELASNLAVSKYTEPFDS